MKALVLATLLASSSARDGMGCRNDDHGGSGCNSDNAQALSVGSALAVLGLATLAIGRKRSK